MFKTRNCISSDQLPNQFSSSRTRAATMVPPSPEGLGRWPCSHQHKQQLLCPLRPHMTCDALSRDGRTRLPGANVLHRDRVRLAGCRHAAGLELGQASGRVGGLRVELPQSLLLPGLRRLPRHLHTEVGSLSLCVCFFSKPLPKYARNC